MITYHPKAMKKTHIILGLFFCLAGLSALSQEFENGAYHIDTGEPIDESVWMNAIKGDIDMFSREGALPITFESNFKQFIARKLKDEYQEALLHFPVFDTIIVKRVVRIKPRGEFRKNYCATPPIRLNMKKTDLDKYTLQRLNKMKMVLSCRSSKTYEELVLREFVVYQLYNVLTDTSFRARLLDVTFKDIGRKKPKSNRSYAFLIEEEKDVAERLDLLPLKIDVLRYEHIQDRAMARFAMFNYMIGNTDWSITDRHNMKLAASKVPGSKHLVIPYDFDYSGIVGAGYAAPDPRFGIANVRQRVLRIPCFSDEILQQTVQEFIDKKAQINATVQDSEYLTETSKKDMLKYIGQFYDIIEAPSAIKYLKNNCGQFL